MDKFFWTVGGGDINEAIIKVGSERGYAKQKYNHRFFQWDNPEPSNNTSNRSNTSINLTTREMYFNQAPPMKFGEKLMQSKISIVNDIGHIVNALGF